MLSTVHVNLVIFTTNTLRVSVALCVFALFTRASLRIAWLFRKPLSASKPRCTSVYAKYGGVSLPAGLASRRRLRGEHDTQVVNGSIPLVWLQSRVNMKSTFCGTLPVLPTRRYQGCTSAQRRNEPGTFGLRVTASLPTRIGTTG